MRLSMLPSRAPGNKILPSLIVIYLTLLSSFIIEPTLSFADIDLEGCQVYKACLVPKKNCPAPECEYAATWRKVNSDNMLEVELLGTMESDTGYIAIGFSKDTKMGDDTVVGCYVSDGSIRIRAAYNWATGDVKGNRFLPAVDEASLFNVSTNEETVRTGGSYDAVHKRLACRFQLRMDLHSDRMFDLSKGKYFILLSRGNAMNLPTGFGKHFPGGEVSTSEAIFQSQMVPRVDVADTRTSRLAKAHGCLMVLAWVLCASIGILAARYYKDVLPPRASRFWRHSSEGAWFQVHRALQITCWLLVTVGFVLIFISIGGYSHGLEYPQSIHPILGIIIFILTFINPFISLCRCKRDSEDRPWFNWIHFIIGTVAYILAVPAMMLGLRMSKAGVHLATLNYPMVVLILFVLFQIIVEVILEFHWCKYYYRYRDRQADYDMQMEDYRIRGGDDTAVLPPKPPHPPGRLFRYFMAGLHATVAVVCAFVLVIAIIVN